MLLNTSIDDSWALASARSVLSRRLSCKARMSSLTGLSAPLHSSIWRSFAWGEREGSGGGGKGGERVVKGEVKGWVERMCCEDRSMRGTLT